MENAQQAEKLHSCLFVNLKPKKYFLYTHDQIQMKINTTGIGDNRNLYKRLYCYFQAFGKVGIENENNLITHIPGTDIR